MRLCNLAPGDKAKNKEQDESGDRNEEKNFSNFNECAAYAAKSKNGKNHPCNKENKRQS